MSSFLRELSWVLESCPDVVSYGHKGFRKGPGRISLFRCLTGLKEMSNSSVRICFACCFKYNSKVDYELLVDKDVSRITTFFTQHRAKHRIIPHGNKWMEWMDLDCQESHSILWCGLKGIFWLVSNNKMGNALESFAYSKLIVCLEGFIFIFLVQQSMQVLRHAAGKLVGTYQLVLFSL